jgi:hypothetical protein
MASKEREELRDLGDKVRNAREAAERDGAGEREKADLKLLEQEAQAEKLRLKHAQKSGAAAARQGADAKPDSKLDRKLDKALKDSFPGSDPVSFVEAAPLKPADKNLSTVPDTKRRGD